MYMYLQFLSFLHMDMAQVVEILPYTVYDKELPSLLSWYHGFWWPGDARNQGVSNHDIDLVNPFPACLG